jgi:hypothetical protein
VGIETQILFDTRGRRKACFYPDYFPTSATVHTLVLMSHLYYSVYGKENIPMLRHLWLICTIIAAGFLILSLGQQPLAQQTTPSYTVWAVDQNNNTLYVLDPDGTVRKTIDGATLGDVKRPHMLWGVPKDAYVYNANTVSNSVTVLSNQNGAECQTLALTRMYGIMMAVGPNGATS